MRALLCLAAALCLSCYPLDSKFQLAIDSTFTSQEWCWTAEAARRWGVVTGGVVDITFSTGVSTVYLWDGADHTAFRGYDEIARAQHRSADALGWTKYDPGGAMWIYVDRIRAMYPDRYAQVFLYTQMHELGHHLGLGHNGPHTLMAGPEEPWSWDERGEPCVTQTDVNAFCNLYACSVIAPQCGVEPKAADAC